MFKIKVLQDDGSIKLLEELSEKEQKEIQQQMKMVSEVAELNITESDELLFS